jgi:hypothetical protein
MLSLDRSPQTLPFDVMDAADDPAYYLAEWYLPEMTTTSVDDVVARLDAAALSVSSEGTPVRLVVTLSVPTDEVLYGVFGAHSSDIVWTTCLQAGAAVPAAFQWCRRNGFSNRLSFDCRLQPNVIDHPQLKL